MNRDNFQKSSLLILVVGISLIFFAMIRNFAMTLLMAGIFAGMLRRPYLRLLPLFRERKSLASLCTLLLFVLAIVIPLLGFFGIVAGQAVDISRSAVPWIESKISQPDEFDQWLRGLPGYEMIEPYREDILKRLAAVAANVGNFAVRGLSAATTGTVAFFFQFFIFLYALFFFLKDGELLLRKILYYLPTSSKDESRLVEKFSSVTRATIKGTLVIGIIQGTGAGLGLYVAGIGGAVFWGTVMVVLSVIPGIGTALVWVPAVIYLVAVDRLLAAILLAVYCGLVVGSVDNLLRPRLVGRDTKMPDLMILLGTIGGLLLFGIAGFIIGPIIAALFITVWEIYGNVFEYALVDRPVQRRRAPAKPRWSPDQKPRDPDDKPRVRGDRPRGDRPRGDRPRGDRPRGDRPRGDRPRGDRPRGDRPRGDRPQGRDDKPGGGDKPRGRDDRRRR